MAPVQPSLGPPRDEPRVFGLDKFNGENFTEWSFKMENIFDHYDLLEVMEGTEKRLENDPEKSPWVQKSAQGYLLLGQALGSSQIRHIKPFQRETEKEPKAWAALKGVHAPATAAVAVVLERQMAALRIEEEEGVEEGVQKFFDLLTRLEGADLNYSELQKKTKLLALFPESWSSLIINLNHDLPCLSLEDVKRAILQEDFCHRELASADGAGAASIGQGYGRRRGRGRRGSRFGSNNFNGGRGSGGYGSDDKSYGRGCGQFDGECHYCHKNGHMWHDKLPDGWTPTQGQEGIGTGGGRGRGRGGRGGRGGGAANMKSDGNESESRDDRFPGQFFFVATQAPAGPEKDEGFEEPAAVRKVTLHSLDYWVIHSGATYSMTPRADLLTKLEPSPVKHVTLALGQRAEVKRMGKAIFKGSDGKMVGLKNVLWVPTLLANLISVRRLQKAGMDTSSKGAKTYIARIGEWISWHLHEDRDVYNEMWQIPTVPMPKEGEVAKCNLGRTSKLGKHKGSDAAAQKQHKGEENPKAAADEEYGESMWGTIASAAFSNPSSATGEYDWLTLHWHVALPILQQLVKEEMVVGIRVKGEPTEVLGCPTCMQATFTHFPFSSSEATAKVLPDEVVMDVVGPLKLGAAGAEYFLTILDVYTHMNWIQRHNHGDGTQLLIEDGLLDYFWPDAVLSACVAQNRALTHVGAEKWVLYVEWIGRKPKVDMLRVFRCMCTALVPKHLQHNKLGTYGKIERYKSRLVAKGYQQKEKVDFKELFAPVCVKGPEEESVGEEERRRFNSLVGSLMYAAINTRPDVAFATGQLARVVQCSNEEQVAAGMRLAKYLGQTSTVGLQYSAMAQRRQKGADGVEPGRLFLTAFSDASYASDSEDMTTYCDYNIAGFASSHRLDYADHLVSGPTRSLLYGVAPVFPLEFLEDRQFELGFLPTTICHLCAMLLAPERNLDTIDIPIPRYHAEAVLGHWASYWIAAEETEMASYRSIGTYVDAVPPPGANVASGMWLYKVMWPPGAPPVFKARYVVRGFSQLEGVDLSQTFAPTRKVTTLRVLLHIEA
ncbi:unnamed protein product [Closterium sp. NIES-53]